MKTFKEILLYVYDVEDIAYAKPALDFARASQGRITGMYALEPVQTGFAISEARSALLETHWREHKARAEAAETQFAELCRDNSDLQSDWTCLEGSPEELLVQQARYADLVIFRHSTAEAHMHFIEKTILAPGGPVMLLPDNCTTDFGGDIKVSIAWDESREAMRAVKDSLPILEKAARVDILTIGAATDVKGQRLHTYLAAHGIEATAHTLSEDSKSIGEVLLNWAETNGAGLLVMGAYGHSRLREIVLGGSTNFILNNARIPVFMSH